MSARFYLFILTICLFIAGCAQEAPKVVSALVVAKKPELTGPFRFHKLIEVSPGNDFDILSWGRGSSSVGSFIILHSDSANMKYNTTTGEMDGSIVDVYNSDMDMDGNPEILIQAKVTDTVNYAVIYAFEFNNGKAQKLDFPKLTKTQKAGYRGNDNFYIEEGKFMREFPLYDGNGKNAKPIGQKRLLQYGLKNNEFTVQQLDKEPTTKITDKPIVKQRVKASSSDNSSTSTTPSKKKKHKIERHTLTHHKKKKHHHSGE
jgi:hypothetical protein